MNERFIKVIATGFGSGYAPFAPGTAGTIVGVPIYLVFAPFPRSLYLLTILALSFLACYVSHEAERIFHQKDAHVIVIDEITGFLWAMLFVVPTTVHILLGFALFRFFDIFKVFPGRLCEERLPGGLGVVMDDVVAGIYANIILQILIRFFSI
ncbi:MAG: phosphatidylglycerophosphatase A [Syntrophales bacterium]|nr:phosphatidylglycerophosphatase A [Syntrophales bacterium]